jgi:hypothetical protein
MSARQLGRVPRQHLTRVEALLGKRTEANCGARKEVQVFDGELQVKAGMTIHADSPPFDSIVSARPLQTRRLELPPFKIGF